ncbi:homeobox protein msx [Holotrichia oblita]|uniref:Homeobox protein msx n=2 Tax=Holotrichia oblita TaxID=644536 RepID=A0ACB9TL57_HOLOL|nr:homeobox protein msx [Holotrichia oblita]KAI4467551.1 homeobox protein msx [Holotrichia oblita]
MTSSNLSSSDDDSRKLLNFSIEHILNKAGNQEPPTKTEQETGDLTTGSLSYIPFPWLHCTRYCPPKIPRNQRRDAPQKRQLGRHPRIPFTTHQLTVLENKFKKSPYLSSQEVKELSKNLDLADIRVTKNYLVQC